MSVAARTFDAAIGAVYTAAAAPERWPAALDAIAACFDGVGTALLLQHADARMSTIVSPALAAAARDYEAGAWRLDFYLPRARERALVQPDAIYTDLNLATADEIASHPFYTDFRARHGLGPFLARHVLPHPEVEAILTVQGRPSRKTFNHRDMQTYTRLAQHAERALMLTVRLLEAEARSEILGEALSRLSCGVVAVDADLRVNFINQAAEKAIGQIARRENGRLVMSDALALAIRQAVATAASPDERGPARPLVMHGDEGVTSFAVYVLPIGQALPQGVRDAFALSRVLLLIIGQESRAPVDPALVRDLLGLSHGEARLASLIGAGQSPREAAHNLGITEISARTILKRIYARTSTSRQSDLALLLSRLVLK